MSQPSQRATGGIRIGDLAWVTKPRLCCGDASAVGRIITVTGFSNGSGCLACGNRYEGLVADVDGKTWLHCEVVRLKRIPPLGELEDEKVKEDIHEPA